MNSPTPPIQIENLTYAYGRAEAVHDLSLTVSPAAVTDSSAAMAPARQPP